MRKPSGRGPWKAARIAHWRLPLHGAEVVGIEGRTGSCAKCEFVKHELELDRAAFLQGDVRKAPSRIDVLSLTIPRNMQDRKTYVTFKGTG